MPKPDTCTVNQLNLTPLSVTVAIEDLNELVCLHPTVATVQENITDAIARRSRNLLGAMISLARVGKATLLESIAEIPDVHIDAPPTQVAHPLAADTPATTAPAKTTSSAAAPETADETLIEAKPASASRSEKNLPTPDGFSRGRWR
jgi:hypothetical protein